MTSHATSIVAVVAMVSSPRPCWFGAERHRQRHAMANGIVAGGPAVGRQLVRQDHRRAEHAADLLPHQRRVLISASCRSSPRRLATTASRWSRWRGRRSSGSRYATRPAVWRCCCSCRWRRSTWARPLKAGSGARRCVLQGSCS
ncbi:hypothetical protein HBB16_12975 [Pseudonocardia sp. MCCB 268]|nr:hypothetical protein [Pseudonocardia cytotoxica]